MERLGEQNLQPKLVQVKQDEREQGSEVDNLAEQQAQTEQRLQSIGDEVQRDLLTEDITEEVLQSDGGLQATGDEVEQELQAENIVQQLQVEQGVQVVENEIYEHIQAENEDEQQFLLIGQGSQTLEEELEPELLCAICNNTAQNNDIRLCECHYKIHHECLKMTLLSTKRSLLHNFTALRCIRCGTIMKIELQPHKTVLVQVMERVARRYRWLCNKLLKCGKFIVVYQALTVHGLAVLLQIYGKKKAIEIANSLGPNISVLLCQSIPLITIGISLSRWEDKLLIGLRRCSRLSVVGGLFPQEYPGVIEPVNCNSTWLTTVVDGLLLPWFGGACGLLLCGFSESGLYRLLLGTSAFLSVRALLYMYHRQMRYYYLGNRTVANYEN